MAVKSIFDLPEFQPYEKRWRARQEELLRRKSYYDGSIYKKMRQRLGWLGPRLYKGIKPLYLPLSRAVDVDAGIIPGGWDFPEDAPRTQVWQEARETIFNWSKWQTEGVLYIHYGAQYGVSGLKIADLREQGKVVVDPAKPTCFMLTHAHQYDDEPAMSIWVEEREDNAGETFEYAEVIDPLAIRTFRNGEPTGFDGREPEYRNELGFVPFVEIEHLKTGEMYGEATYQKAIPLLDEVNELASYLADIIRKHAEPQWAVFGAEPSDLVKSGDNVWFFHSTDSKATPLLAQIDVPGVLDFVREIRDQVHGSLPELAFDELRKKEQIATATLELQLMELVIKVKRTRPNYDDGLVQALRLAGRAGASMSLSEIAVLDDEDLTFDEERPVLPLDPETEMRLEMQALALERERAMGTDEGAMDDDDGDGGGEDD